MSLERKRRLKELERWATSRLGLGQVTAATFDVVSREAIRRWGVSRPTALDYAYSVLTTLKPNKSLWQIDADFAAYLHRIVWGD